MLSLVYMHTRLSTSVLYFEHVLWNEISSRTTGNVGPVLGLGLDTPSQAAHMQPHLFQIDKYLLNRWANSWCMMNSFWKLTFCFRFVFLHILSKQFGCMFKKNWMIIVVSTHHPRHWPQGVPALLYNLPQSSSLPICHFPLCREWQEGPVASTTPFLNLLPSFS